MLTNVRCFLSIAANPPSGRYDDLRTTAENIDLQSTILSRFDLIFIVRDSAEPEKDMAIAKWVLLLLVALTSSNAIYRVRQGVMSYETACIIRASPFT